MSFKTQDFYNFGDFRLDPAERILTRDGNVIPITPKVFETLLVLVENAGRTIGKEELMQMIWQDRFVEESNLTFNIGMLRKALGDDAAKPRYVETVPRRGYRFIAAVERVRKNDERESNLSNAVLPYRPVESPRPRRVSSGKHGVVVALADWQHEANENEPAQIPPATASAESIEQTVKPEPISPTLNGRNQLVSKYRLPTAAFALATLLISAGILGYYLFAAKQATGVNVKKLIAVLPLKPINTVTRDEIYEIGIADSLIHRLSSIKGLVVRPLSATRKYGDIGQDALIAGKEQQVDFVFASNYQLAGGKIRVTAQLLNVASGQIEKTYKIEKDAGDVFAMQDTIAGEVENLLLAHFATTLNGQTVERGTSNEEAYRLYLQGMYLIDKENAADAKRAIELFDEAVAIDLNYAKAWAAKARAHCVSAHWGGSSSDEQFVFAKPAIERAFALDANLPEAHAVLGVIKADYEWNFAEAEKHFLQAIETAPNSDIFRRWYANRLSAQGRSEEAVAMIETAIDLNPNSFNHQIFYGKILYFARRFDDAIIQLKRVSEIDSTNPLSHNILWRCFHKKEDYPRAYESFVRFQQLNGTKDEVLKDYETLYAESGWQNVLLKNIENLKRAENANSSTAYTIAVLSALTDESDQSIQYLEKAVKNRSLDIPNIKNDPGLDSLRDGLRFDELIKNAALK